MEKEPVMFARRTLFATTAAAALTLTVGLAGGCETQERPAEHPQMHEQTPTQPPAEQPGQAPPPPAQDQPPAQEPGGLY